jgi:ubiquinone/menaquinone biosynthesis C-methylase UbiE
MESIFFEVFSDLPRQGPGDTQLSLQILDSIKNNSTIKQLADIGCGTGKITLQLAQSIEGAVTAVDNYQPYLDDLKIEAEKLGIADRVTCVSADMKSLPFSEEAFDIIWSEGAIYIMGFEEGLNYWKQYLKPQGWMVVSDANFFKPDTPQEVKEFWENEYPQMMSVTENIEVIERNGFNLSEKHFLPKAGWSDNFYSPLQVNVNRLRKKYQNNKKALEEIDIVQHEIDLYLKYHDYYGYTFYVMQKME